MQNLACLGIFLRKGFWHIWHKCICAICSALATFATLSHAQNLPRPPLITKDAPQITERIKPSTKHNAVYSYYDIIEKSRKSVVSIYLQGITDRLGIEPQMLQEDIYKKALGSAYSDLPLLPNSLGSGVIISKDGYIITNQHVVRGADKVIVKLYNDSQEYIAQVIGTDKETDLAVVKIDIPRYIKELIFIEFANSDEARVGDMVFAIGNNDGFSDSVTQGIISAKNRILLQGFKQYQNYIQTDAAINSGNSGGALMDSRGALVGINSVGIPDKDGLGFAIPSNLAKAIALELVENGAINRGYISGIKVDDYQMVENGVRTQGVKITELNQNSTAHKAGLHTNDIITHINGKILHNVGEYENELSLLRSDKKATFTIMREYVGNATNDNKQHSENLSQNLHENPKQILQIEILPSATK
ncbi:S1C family serine protease [Helicobacter sp. T3_23-1056]